jgi:MSHA biogenesis protein MshO
MAIDFVMRPTRPDKQRGFTLIEMIIAMIITGIVVALTLFFTLPMQQAVDVSVRAELTDIAHNSLQRIGRDVRLALPNSVRTNGAAVEFIPLRTGGRYRVEAVGACTGASDDHLAFGAADGCFKSLGPVLHDTTVTNSDFLVLNNYGENFTDQNAYADPTLEPNGGNRRQIAAAIVGQQRVTYLAGATGFSRTLHDSPGRRFFIVSTPVSYVCDLTAGTIDRYEGYGFNATQQVPPAATPARLASNVIACSFDYSANVAPMVGLLTMTLTLRKAVSTGTETVRLYHSVHVNNVP